MGVLLVSTLVLVYMVDLEEVKGGLVGGGNVTKGGEMPPVEEVVMEVAMKVVEGCPRVECTESMDVNCATKDGNIEAWSPPVATLASLATNNTIFLTIYRTPNPKEPLSDMWYNMLHHFSLALPTSTLLLGMSHCPHPPLEYVTGMDYWWKESELHKGGTLPPSTTHCFTLPHPCDCPAKLMHAKCKFAVILSILKKGFSVFWMDSDTVLLNNPLKDVHPAGVDLLGCYEQAYHLNLGLLRIAPTQRSIEAFQVALESLHDEKGMEEATRKSPHGFGGPWLYEQALVAQLFHLNGVGATKYPVMPLSRRITSAPFGQTWIAKAEAWNAIQYPCRAQNKRYLPAWRHDAAQGKVIGIHASGGCGSHVWLKKGFLIELKAWYNQTESNDYTAFCAKVASLKKAQKRR
eukprot:TRINITY_DN29090_c0_g1_i1.p1 TRINITY_DN29090_c0_g1~~TRINITY_DN29090_c0_g1_i1.p1  ORF type:complete len:448 (+),score=73.21 TRINITY_DN29090_c0_g1_i1:132-1346(+)